MRYFFAVIVLCASCLVHAGHHETGKDSANVEAMKAAYASFARGDMEAWKAEHSDDVVWTILEGLPYSGTYVGKQAIIGFPNFGHWQCRLQLAFRGQMPISKTLPNQWYDTTNIHLCTINDFEQICTDKNIQIKQRSIVDHAHQDSLGIKISPNLFGEIALYQIKKSH